MTDMEKESAYMAGVKLSNSTGAFIKGENVNGKHMYKDTEVYGETGKVCYASDSQLARLSEEYDLRESFIREPDIIFMNLGEDCSSILDKVIKAKGGKSCSAMDIRKAADIVYANADGRDIEDIISAIGIDALLDDGLKKTL